MRKVQLAVNGVGICEESSACCKWSGHISNFANPLPKNLLKIAINNVLFLDRRKEATAAHEFSKSDGSASLFSCIRPIRRFFE